MDAYQLSEHDPAWARVFGTLSDHLWPLLRDLAIGIHHVGSTAVPGLPAKPIIDIDVVVECDSKLQVAIERLTKCGYRHVGDLGVRGREAFKQPASLPRHHLYVCVLGCDALLNHLTLRDLLRADPGAAAEYGQLKRSLIAQGLDRDEYGQGKTAFIVSLLRRAGFRDEVLARIEAESAPRRPEASGRDARTG